MLLQIAREAAANLIGAKQRSLLALIGIVIGTASVIAMTNVGQMVTAQALQQFEAMGTDLFTINISPTQTFKGLDLEVAERFADTPGVRVLVPVITGGPGFIRDGQRGFAQTVGTTEAFLNVAKLQVDKGRFVSTIDGSEPFVVVGSKAFEGGFGAQAITPARPGDTLQIGDSLFAVVGELAPAAFNPLLPVDANRTLFVPAPAMRRIAEQAKVSMLVGRAAPGHDTRQAAEAVHHRIAEKAPGANARVQLAEELIATMQQQMRLFTLLLGAIGSISLIVGGVGVMNIMLVSVTERRREIGLRLAIGARPREITWQFLTEAVMLSLAGGAIGLVAGMATAYGFGEMNGIPFFISSQGLVLGVAVSVLIGVFFGYYPASRAAKLDPIEALRSE